jgi:hypothetical protein
LGQLGANWMLFWAILAPTRTKLAPRRPKDEKKQEYLLEIDMILYRNYKINGKHINFLVYVNHTRERVIDITIKGVVGEDKIGFNPIVQEDTTEYVSFESVETLI